MRGVGFGDGNRHPAILSLRFELTAFPCWASQVDGQPPVLGIAADVSGNPLQMNPAVHRIEFDAPADIGDADSTVVRLQAQIRCLRHENLVADAPPAVSTLGRAVGADLTARRLHLNLAYNRMRLAVGIGPRLDLQRTSTSFRSQPFTVAPPFWP